MFMLQYQNTQIRLGLQTEDFKLKWGNHSVFTPEQIDSYPGELYLPAGRRDWVAF